MNALEKMLFSILSLLSLWDGFTTVFGTFNILYVKENYINTVIISVVFSIIILSTLVLTSFIIRTNNATGMILKSIWGVVLTYDLWTSYIGNKRFVLGGQVANMQQEIVLIGITLLVSASPIFLSIFFLDRYEPEV